MTKKCFLMEGGTWEDSKNWWKLDSAKQCKTLEKKMDNYLKNWDGHRRFAIVKAENAVNARRLLRDTDILRRQRKAGITRYDRVYDRKSNKNYWGEIVKIKKK